MLFNSYTFLFFLLPLVLAGYYLFLPKRWRHGWLVLASYVFYGWWDWRFCGLLLLTTCTDYFIGGRVHAAREAWKKRAWVAASVCVDLGVLGFFKYYDLGAETANAVGAWLGLGGGIPLLHLVLPVGISFYTFQAMSYTIDIYRGEAEPARNFTDFACYVSMFPQLVAGPIVRYRDMDRQLKEREPTWEQAWAGVVLFAMGLAKKVLVADGVAPLADWSFSQAAPGLWEAWSGLLAYTMQIYFDFSGYSDMAVGLGLMLGFQFPQNFDSPYKSLSMTEFWRRWHISLSSWLKDYLYIPLGGNRKGEVRTYWNLFLTMLLGGLWHGASWTFVGWGAYHGVWLALERMNGKRSWLWRTPQWVQRGWTFLLAMGGWLLFRAANTAELGRMARGLAGLNGWGEAYGWSGGGKLNWALLAVAAGLAFFAKNSWEVKVRAGWRGALWAGVLLAVGVAVLSVNASSPFLYFQF